MAKTQLTRDIESALHSWHPSSYGGYRVDSFRQGFDAIEVPVECGSVKSGLVDFVRVQECFTSETKYGTCKLASLIETDTGASLAAIQQKAKEATCVKDISSIDFAGSTVPSNGATSTRRIICIRSMPSSLVWKSRFP